MTISVKLGNIINLASPTRELIKEGDVRKLSGEADEYETRRVYLVSSVNYSH